MIKKLLVLFGLICACPNFAQVKGKVTEVSSSKDAIGLPGVTIFWLNTSIGSTTDTNGLFSISSTSETNKLVITAIGYKSDTLVIKDTTKFLSIRLKGGVDLTEVEVVYESTGTELSYMNTIKVETLNERSLMKAACCNLSESFETNPSVDVNFADAVTGTKQIQMLGLSGQYAQITKENMPYMRGLENGYG